MSKIQSVPKKKVSEEKEIGKEVEVSQVSNSEEIERLDRSKISEDGILLLEEDKAKI